MCRGSKSRHTTRCAFVSLAQTRALLPDILEALLADSTHVAEKLAVFLDQDKPFNFDLNTAIVQRQSNFINTLWMTKFRAENENFLDAIQQ